MINLPEKESRPESEIGVRFLAGFSDSTEKEAAHKLLAVVNQFRGLISNSSETPSSNEKDDSYFNLYSQVRECLSGRDCDNEQLDNLRDVVELYGIRHQYVFDIIRGIKREHQAREFNDFADLSTCAYLNSSSVLACIVKIMSRRPQVEFDFVQESAVLELGVVDYLVQKLTRMVGQLEAKKYFIPFLEIQDRGLDLMNQVDPIDELLWKDLIQFQCMRLMEKLDATRVLSKLVPSRLKRQLNLLAITNQMLIKQMRRNPAQMLRDEINLGWTSNWKAGVQKWIGAPK